MKKIRDALTRPLCLNGVPTWLVCIGLAIVQTGFGLYPVLIKLYGSDVKANPLVLSFYRDACCVPILFLCAIVAERKLMRPSATMLFLFVTLGLAMFSSQYLYILAVYNAGPTLTSAFQPTIPIWTSIVAAITCIEKLPSYRTLMFWAKFLGIFLVAGGAIEIVLTDKKVHGTSEVKHTIGYLLVFCFTVIVALYILVQKRFIFSKPDNIWRDYPVSVTAYSYVFGAIFMGLASLQYVTKPVEYKLPLQSLYVLVYAIFVTSSLCYLLLTWANSHVSSILVTAFWPVQVLVAVIVSWFVIGDHLAPLQYLGASILIIGLFLVLWSEYQDEREKKGKENCVSRISLDFCCNHKNSEQQHLLN